MNTNFSYNISLGDLIVEKDRISSHPWWLGLILVMILIICVCGFTGKK